MKEKPNYYQRIRARMEMGMAGLDEKQAVVEIDNLNSRLAAAERRVGELEAFVEAVKEAKNRVWVDIIDPTASKEMRNAARIEFVNAINVALAALARKDTP